MSVGFTYSTGSLALYTQTFMLPHNTKETSSPLEEAHPYYVLSGQRDEANLTIVRNCRKADDVHSDNSHWFVLQT